MELIEALEREVAEHNGFTWPMDDYEAKVVADDLRMKAVAEIKRQNQRVTNHLIAYVAFLNSLKNRLEAGEDGKSVAQSAANAAEALQKLKDGQIKLNIQPNL